MRAYYNDSDAYSAQWLRNLAATRHVSPGTVDDRSILDVQSSDLAGFERVHLFAGIGLWDYALDLAGWSGPVWTGSCPCQPFSTAGRQRAHLDERHLWPAFYRLVAECRPAVVFGEQIAGKLGGTWVAAVRHDLEGLGYRVGAAALPACGVGAPHIRSRIYWVAIADGAGRGFVGGELSSHRDAPSGGDADRCGPAGRLADAARGGWREECADGSRGDERGLAPGTEQRLGRDHATRRLDDTGRAGLPDAEPSQLCGAERDHEGRAASEPSGAPNPWSELEWIACRDGKWWPAQSGIFPLAARHPGDVAKLRAYGNSIVPQVAAAFIRAVMDVIRG